MAATFLLLGLALVAWRLAAGSRPATPGSVRWADVRRLRHVDRRPDEVTTADVARLLRSRGLPADEVRFVLSTAGRLGVGATTLWTWSKHFDVHALGVVLGAGLAEAELLRHLGTGTLPDLADLEVLAVLGGLPRRTSVGAAAGPAPRAVPREPGSGLLIEDPGSWPYTS